MNALYGLLAGFVERALRIPKAPSAPPGDEGSTRVFRASPRFYLYRLLGWGLGRGFTLLILLGAAGALETSARQVDELAPWAHAIVVVMLLGYGAQTLLSWVALRLDYDKRWYLITDRSLRIRSGVVHVSEMTITFANIQNLSISQGPLQRLFGISDLRVDTAGGSAVAAGGPQQRAGFHTAWFQGVDDAERIRELMQERLRRVRDAGLGDPDDDREQDAGDDASGLGRPADRGTADAEAGDDALLSVLRQIRAEARALRALAGSE